MSTFNGCGTLYYDWSHLPDGTAHATRWFVLFLFPVVPLRRHHLRVITHGEKPSFFSSKNTAAWHTEFEIYGTVPMEALGILRTYIKAYLLLPLVLMLPAAALMFVAFRVVLPPIHNVNSATAWQTSVAAATGLLVILYWALVGAHILDRARGLKK